MAELKGLGERLGVWNGVCGEYRLSADEEMDWQCYRVLVFLKLRFWQPKRQTFLGEKYHLMCCPSSIWVNSSATSGLFLRHCTVPSWNWWVILLIWIIFPNKCWVVFEQLSLLCAPCWVGLWLWGPQCLLGCLIWDLLCETFCQADEVNLLTKQSNKHLN